VVNAPTDVEDAVQEALLTAATQWPDHGLPDNPHGWLVTVANRRLTDSQRANHARRKTTGYPTTTGSTQHGHTYWK
jgi:predicted RNA polymerase sigma factor